ncbi:hypothetical protein INT50_12405 [Vibrio diabolicus]|uniref:hypothetical protein n=1 Tax=Vibrio harveyi group TaxID=717610 RepID=UPI000A3A00FD|nr:MULTISPECIES: hypothetical protein [Vibrio harveyi group]MBE4076702.1 hypothetical protein [Vibrio parahaemolyticus]MBE5175872.1 hypothetical protein [Vibrio parahaemolyticus]MCI9718752.1 hypothetical protein [Vibrio parahaemolyticus]OUJ36691.1 hypothetical protein BTR40_06690 [Vibrio parahaemolyticus]QOV29451.1 hypothetical protein INT50_12405 [Vibrio diabolicus]
MAHTFTNEDRNKAVQSSNHGKRGKASRTWARKFIERYCEDNDPEQVAEAAKHVLTLSDNVQLSDKHLKEIAFQRHLLNLQLNQKIQEYQAKKAIDEIAEESKAARDLTTSQAKSLFKEITKNMTAEQREAMWKQLEASDE